MSTFYASIFGSSSSSTASSATPNASLSLSLASNTSPESIVLLASQALQVIINHHKVPPVVEAVAPTESTSSSASSPSSSSASNAFYTNYSSLPSEIIQSNESLCTCLSQLRKLLYGAPNQPEIDQSKAKEFTNSIINHNNFIALLITHMNIVPFEGRKNIALIYNNLIRRNSLGSTDSQTFIRYIVNNPSIIYTLIENYSNNDIALNSGTMIRESLMNSDEIVLLVLRSSYIWKFFEVYSQLPTFDVASDAFNTLKELLIPRNKALSAAFIEENYETFVKHYENLLNSTNYVTKRRSLKLLYDILLDKSNFNVMMRYIRSRGNLKVIMNLLRDKSPNIQFEAFQIFKIFVANPNKEEEILVILYKNKEKLVSFLRAFQTERDCAQFSDEKGLLIDALVRIEIPATEAA